MNRKADSGERWTVPLGGGAGRRFNLGKQPVNVQSQAYGNVERPRYGPDWSLRFQVQFLFPMRWGVAKKSNCCFVIHELSFDLAEAA